MENKYVVNLNIGSIGHMDLSKKPLADFIAKVNAGERDVFGTWGRPTRMEMEPYSKFLDRYQSSYATDKSCLQVKKVFVAEDGTVQADIVPAGPLSAQLVSAISSGEDVGLKPTFGIRALVNPSREIKEIISIDLINFTPKQ